MDEEKTTDSSQEEQTPAPKAEKSYSQQDINKIVKDRLSRAEKKYQQEVQMKVEEALEGFKLEHGLDEQTLEGLGKRDEVASQLHGLKIEKGKVDKKLQEYMSKFDMVNGKLTEALTRDAVLRAAAGKSVDPQAVWKIVRDDIQLDEEYNVFALENGERSEKTVQEYVDNFLENNKYLAAPTVTNTGGGSRPSRSESPVKDSGKTKAARLDMLRDIFGE